MCHNKPRESTLLAGFLASAILLNSSGCIPDHRTVPPPPDPEWPTVLEATPTRPEQGVQWLDFGTSAPSPVAIHFEGHLIALRTSCETILYDLRSGKRLHAWLLPTTVAYLSRDGTHVLTRRKNAFELWETSRFSRLHAFPGNPPTWREVLQEDGNLIAQQRSLIGTLNHDSSLVAIANSFQVFDRRSPAGLMIFSAFGKLRHVLQVPDGAEIQSVQFLLDDRVLMSYTAVENRQRVPQYELWDPITGKLIRRFLTGATVRASRDNRRLAAARLIPKYPRNDQPPPAMLVNLWDVQTGRLLRTVERPTPLRDFALHPDGKRLLAPVEDRLVEWEVDSGEVVFEGEQSEHSYASVLYSPDGASRFATVEIPNGLDDDVDHHLRGWDVATGKVLPIADFAFDSYNGTEELFIFPAGDRFVDLATTFCVRDLMTGETLQTAPPFRRPQHEAAITPDGKFIVTGGALTEIATGKQRRWKLVGAKHTFVESGHTLFSGNHTGLFLTDIARGTIFWKLLVKSVYGVADVASSADAKRLVGAYRIGSDESTTRLFVIDPLKPDEPLIMSQCASAVCVSPDHRRFIVASHHAVEERDTDTGAITRSLWTPPGRVLFAEYSEQGTQIVVGGVVDHRDFREPWDLDDDGWASVIDLETQEVVSLVGHTAPVATAAFSADGKRCVTGSLDRTLRLWDTASGSTLHVFRGHLGPVHRVAYSPLGGRILSAAADGMAFWDVPDSVDVESTPRPLAKSFQPVESVSAWLHLRSQPHPSVLFPSVELATRRADPTWGTAEWSLVELGDAPRDSSVPVAWLKRARNRRQVPSEHEPIPSHVPAGHKTLGSSQNEQRRLYSTQAGRTLLVMDADGEILSQWNMPRTHDYACAISPSGKYVVIARETTSGERPYQNGTCELAVYDAESGAVLRKFDSISARYLHSIEFAPNEETILLQKNNNSLELRDFHTGQVLGDLTYIPGGAGLRARFSPDGRFVVTSKYPSPVVNLRNPTTLELVKALENPMPVRWFRMTPDGRQLLAGQPYAGYEGSSRVIDLVTKWDLKTGNRLWSRAGPASIEGTFSHSQKYYLTKSARHLWTLWDTVAGTIQCVVVCQNNDVTSCRPVFNEETRALHLGTADGEILWSNESAP